MVPCIIWLFFTLGKKAMLLVICKKTWLIVPLKIHWFNKVVLCMQLFIHTTIVFYKLKYTFSS